MLYEEWKKREKLARKVVRLFRECGGKDKFLAFARTVDEPRVGRPPALQRLAPSIRRAVEIDEGVQRYRAAGSPDPYKEAWRDLFEFEFDRLPRDDEELQQYRKRMQRRVTEGRAFLRKNPDAD